MLERLVIFPEHRGRGVGLTVLRTLIERYRMGMGLIAMKPYPLQYEFFREDEVEDIPRAVLGLDLFHGSHAASTKKLKAYYGRLGFKNVPRTGYMVRDAIAPLTE
jgi:GNAT superfamily N-acetyltransferase